MEKDRPNLDKLRQLCDELTDRDSQLKKNAAALWEILELLKSVNDDLSRIKPKDPHVEEQLGECMTDLDRISAILEQKGCKKVDHE